MTKIEKEFYPSSGLSRVFEMKDGKKNGTQKGFFKDGSLMFRMEFVDGKRHGKSTIWRENGSAGPKSIEVFDNDRRHGECRYYDEEGRMIIKINYRYGKQEGRTEEYHEGYLVFEKSYLKGELHGEQKNCDMHGKSAGSVWFINGVLSTRWKYDEYMLNIDKSEKKEKMHDLEDQIAKIMQRFTDETIYRNQLAQFIVRNKEDFIQAFSAKVEADLECPKCSHEYHVTLERCKQSS